MIAAVKLYVNKMTNESGPGMKILLMDKDTVELFWICSFPPKQKMDSHSIDIFHFVRSIDKHYFDGIQSIGHAAERSVFV